ncbi:MAG: serine/threonine protein kinase, partial [Thermoanaerobaculales bacterium]|nr:serine/threonine protein kinase [Thermoanaerobaculales bacterium]
MLERIGHYRIVAELGRGGMGVVYKAHEESLNRFVAIKVLGEHLTEDPSHVQRFLREAQSAASLNHPNIVQIYAISQDQGRHYFVMEHVTGQSLQKVLRSRGRLDAIQTARIALQTASGLRAAHEHGVIHRDIKPANLLIDDRGLVKIADFGLALMGNAASRLTATGMFMGTPGYLSPEQCLDKDIDHRTDIYSLGVTLFEALSGKAPFTGDSPLALLRQIIEVEPPDLGELQPGVDPELRTLVQRMMAKDRDLRIASCAELVDALERFLAARGAVGSLVERLAAATASGAPPPPPPPARVADLDSQPTTAVSGDLPGSVAPPPPPLPVIESAPVERPAPGSGRKLALVAALVVALGLAAVVVGGVFAWRSGALSRVARLATSARTAPTAAARGAEVPPDQARAETPEPASGALGASGPAAATSRGEAVREPVARATAPLAGAGQPAAGGAASGPAPAEAAPARPAREAASGPAEPARPTVPPPEGTAVIAVGDPLLAGEAEAFIEAALARAGVPLVDEAGVPGLEALISGAEERRPGDAHGLLQPYARHLVMVRVEYLGERPLVYMG